MGGSRGLGLEVARLLAGADYRLTIVGRDQEGLESAVKSFIGSGHRAWRLDLSEPSDTRGLLDRLEHESFELLINNAGASRFGPYAELAQGIVEGLLWLNFTAPALLCHQFLRTCSSKATFVNVTSIVGVVPMPGNGLYSSAKAGMRTLSECLWFEARDRGVRVLEFRPVSLKTDFHRLAGRNSLASPRMAVDPARVANDLIRALAGRRDFAYGPGLPARILGAVNHLLPRRLIVEWMGKKSTRSGYFATPPLSVPAPNTEARGTRSASAPDAAGNPT